MLGPLEVLVDGEPVALGGRMQRAGLAILLAEANDTVSVERLVDGVWDEDPPETAANLIQGYVSQLRKALGRERIATRGKGYAVTVGPGELDLERFEAKVGSGSAADLSEALGLWRGGALSDLADVPGVRPIAARLDELRLVATEQRIAADLEGGQAAEAAAELQALIAEHPLREHLWGLRMLALYRAGRQAEALEAYREARSALVAELGIEPGTELRALEQAILRQDRSLDPPTGARPVAAGERQAPRRSVLAAALAGDALAPLADLGAALAEHADHELMLAATVTSTAELADLTSRLREVGEPLSARGVAVRTGAFTSVAPGSDLSRLAREQDVDLLLADAPSGLLEDPRVLHLLEDSPCDVAIVVGDGVPRPGPVFVPFSGFEHDWAAIELGAWLALALERRLQLAGPSTGPSGRDASRMLASASLALQRGLGVEADPVIVEPSPQALVEAAGESGIVVVGLTERWRRDGLGGARTALATSASTPTLLVRRGLRPGGLAPRPGDTRFTWTIAASEG